MSKTKDKDPVFESLTQALEDLFPNYHEQKQKNAFAGNTCSWNVDASSFQRVSVLANRTHASASPQHALGR